GQMAVVEDTSVVSWGLRTLLAFGVTTVRDPGAPAELAVAVRDSVARGELLGPRILTAGDIIDQVVFPGLAETVRTPDEVRAAVRRQAGVGVDYIKLYTSLDPASLAAGIDEAHRAGKKVIGHLFATSWTEAAGLGIDYLVHSFPLSPKLLTPERRAAWRASMVRNAGFMFQWHEFYDPESAEADSMIRALVARRIPHDPTLAIFEAIAWGDSARVIDNPDLAHAHPVLLENWRKTFTLSAGFTPEDFDRAQRTWPLVRRFVKQLHDRGVLLTAGSDASNPWVPAGPSLHRELELLVDAGIPPREVLRMATRNGAEALGLLDQTGTVEVGKRADLVLLEADPEASIANTRAIAWVMQGGQRWSPDELLAGRAKARP
ncbi:MAG: amidohydrolase family protein, partial [Gemmatimonadales bacterium]